MRPAPLKNFSVRLQQKNKPVGLFISFCKYIEQPNSPKPHKALHRRFITGGKHSGSAEKKNGPTRQHQEKLM